MPRPTHCMKRVCERVSPHWVRIIPGRSIRWIIWQCCILQSRSIQAGPSPVWRVFGKSTVHTGRPTPCFRWIIGQHFMASKANIRRPAPCGKSAEKGGWKYEFTWATLPRIELIYQGTIATYNVGLAFGLYLSELGGVSPLVTCQSCTAFLLSYDLLNDRPKLIYHSTCSRWQQFKRARL